MQQRLELLAPAGSIEKLKVVLHYGADAVYGGLSDFSLRGRRGSFESLEELSKGIEYAHSRGARFYVTLNSFLREEQIEDFRQLIAKIATLGPDAFIISDPGAIAIALDEAFWIPVHLSTQGNNLNSAAVNFWAKRGISRIILARELSAGEIQGIHKNTNVKLECFIHGAMCISFSGRCMLSRYMTGRDANMGDCAQPCRWKYTLVEEKRPGQYFPIEEDDNGTYFFNSKDLCLIEHIPAMVEAGIESVKIEGRMKTANYLAAAVSVYRSAMDSYLLNPAGYKVEPIWQDELEKINTRGYTTGFFIPDTKPTENSKGHQAVSAHRYVAIITDVLDSKRYKIMVKNSISVGDELELFGKNLSVYKETIECIKDTEGNNLEKVNPNQEAIISLKHNASEMEILRKML